MTIEIPAWALYVLTFIAGWMVGAFKRWLDKETHN